MPKKIDKIQEYKDKWVSIGVSTISGSDDDIKQVISNIYEENERKVPPIIIVNSPKEANILIQNCYANFKDNPEKILEWINNGNEIKQLNNNIEVPSGYGQFEAYWLASYDYIKNELHEKIDSKIDNMFKLAELCSFWWSYEKICIVSRKPTRINIENEKLHDLRGPAVEFSDGFKIFALDGERMSYSKWNELTIPFRSTLGQIVFKNEKN